MNVIRTDETSTSTRAGLSVPRKFTTPETHPYDTIRWSHRTTRITNDEGTVIFEQEDAEFPESWSQLASNVVSSKYFHGAADGPDRENSLRQLIDRVAHTIRAWGERDGYFVDEDAAEAFQSELIYLLVHQMAAFNSPVWFNCGVEETPQCSACFINSVQDSMESILDLAKTEGLLFKYGSGSGTNLSPLRSSREQLSTGGLASGPVSFMKGFDAFAGVIKSGGKTRRAAKMVILNAEHPDILEFIECKVREEQKAWALIDAGYDGSFTGEAYASVFFQNSNNSVRVSDAFMRAVQENGDWDTRAVTDRRVIDTLPARDLLDRISEATHLCGDPGLQYDTTINSWHTCPNSGRIEASNPCSEYMFLNESACNLASLNLMKFRDKDGEFLADAFTHAVRIMIIAQDIIVDRASYPTTAITENSKAYRPLGLGYANLGALLMARGLAYDSDEGRDYAAAITALMCGESYRVSSELAEKLEPFEFFEENREPMLHVIARHRSAVAKINAHRIPDALLEAAQSAWDQAHAHGVDFGYRNSQVTVLAPTGTIGFMMDCDTTGIEPDLALVKYKKLAGGGVLKMVNRSVGEALTRLGYADEQVAEIVEYVNERETIEGAPHLKEEHLSVFDCAFRPMQGKRAIHYMGHVRMMSAVQPFLSGAISKTVNMPEEATKEEIAQTYIEAWKLGLKSIAIYRNNSKRTQPMSADSGTKSDAGKPGSLTQPRRRRLPDERHSITHKFSIGGHEGYITVGLYEDGNPGEIFVRMSKEGTVVSGLMDSFATATSIMLQYGVPLKVLVDKFSHTRFEPAGFTNNRQIPIAKSIMDYLFRWLGLKFMPEFANLETDALDSPASPQVTETANREQVTFQLQADAPPCMECGTIMVRNGACYKCLNCGFSYGCS